MSTNPLFQHRHYVCMAKIIADIRDETTRKFVAAMFANALASTNPLFDYNRFIDAAQGEPRNRDRLS